MGSFFKERLFAGWEWLSPALRVTSPINVGWAVPTGCGYPLSHAFGVPALPEGEPVGGDRRPYGVRRESNEGPSGSVSPYGEDGIYKLFTELVLTVT